MSNLNFRAIVLSLILSVCLWIVFTLNSEFEATYTFKVEYINLPEDKASIFKLTPFINAQFTADGWDFIKYNRSKRNRTVSIDYNFDKEIENRITEKTIRDKIKDQTPSYLTISNVTPKKIILIFKDKKVKKVPVIANKKISLAPDYEIIGDFTFTPDSVEISGPEVEITKIKNWKTDSLVIKNLSNSVNGDLNLLELTESPVVLSQKSIKYNLQVERYTEKNIEIEVQIINNDSDKKIMLLPNKVNLKFIVPISKYDKIIADEFTIVADFEKDAKKGLVSLQLTNKPDYIKNPSYYPKSIEYIKYE